MLGDGLVFCHVSSFLTGPREVSLPFSDYCEPLGPDWAPLLNALQAKPGKYVEIRPSSPSQPPVCGYGAGQRFLRHAIDLRPGPEALFPRMHKDSIQRKIRRGVRDGLNIRRDGEPDWFFRLFVQTRRRHGSPPPPKRWFANVREYQSSARIWIAEHAGKAIASVFTLRLGSTLYYKYGASDEAYHALGGMPTLFWELVQEGCATGCTALDLGRSDLDGEGLIRFKERLGA